MRSPNVLAGNYISLSWRSSLYLLPCLVFVVTGFERGGLLFKTKETFKFADLFCLESSLARRFGSSGNNRENDDTRCFQRLVLDTSTGSTLLYWADYANPNDHEHPTAQGRLLSPSMPLLKRCDWVGQIVCQGTNAESLLDHSESITHEFDNWSLEYVRMMDVQSNRRSHTESRQRSSSTYTSRTLLTCLAQRLRGSAALNPKHVVDRLILVDTSPNAIYLVLVLQQAHPSPQTYSLFQESWPNRPFPYSAALHPVIAEVIVDTLFGLVGACGEGGVTYRGTTDGEIMSHNITFLDPTCGSGTLLAYTLIKFDEWQQQRVEDNSSSSSSSSIQLIGWDINPKCIGGTRANLIHCFGKDRVKQDCTLEVRDSAATDDYEAALRVKSDCQGQQQQQQFLVAANLPWGQNTALVDCERILQTIHQGLFGSATNTTWPVPCAFVTKGDIMPFHDQDDVSIARTATSSIDVDGVEKWWRDLGYQVLGSASVPQQGFALPYSRKRSKKNKADEQGAPRTARAATSSGCTVTFALMHSPGCHQPN